jgi:hypothetical protein
MKFLITRLNSVKDTNISFSENADNSRQKRQLFGSQLSWKMKPDLKRSLTCKKSYELQAERGYRKEGEL